MFLFGEEFHKILDLPGIPQVMLANPGPAQSRKMRSAAKVFAHVAGQRPDVGPFGAGNTKIGIGQGDPGNFKGGNVDPPRENLNLDILPGRFVGPFPVNLDC